MSDPPEPIDGEPIERYMDRVHLWLKWQAQHLAKLARATSDRPRSETRQQWRSRMGLHVDSDVDRLTAEIKRLRADREAERRRWEVRVCDLEQEIEGLRSQVKLRDDAIDSLTCTHAENKARLVIAERLAEKAQEAIDFEHARLIHVTGDHKRDMRAPDGITPLWWVDLSDVLAEWEDNK